jgi:hypothetical protein
VHETIAILFDFDDTLGPDSTSGFLEHHGVDVPTFWRDVQPLLDEGWDPVPAYLHRMLELGRSGVIPPIDRAALENWGHQLPLHRGVPELFRRLREECHVANPRARLEFYLISSGLGDVLRKSSVAREFTDIWASDFAYDRDGRACGVRKVVSFTDKTRYVFQVQKGLVGPEWQNKPFEVNRKVPASRLRVPMDRMIVVGDGMTDVPCFSLVRGGGGVAVGVYDRENRRKWGRAWGFIEDGRVSNLLPSEFEPSSALSTFLSMAVENIARKIAAAHVVGGVPL